MIINKLNMASKIHPTVAIEGIDGCGKTTISENLARELNGSCLHTPPTEFSKVKYLFEDNPSLIISRFLYYASGLHLSYEKASSLLMKGPVIFDRYTLSTLLYHEELFAAHNIDFNINKLSEKIFPAPADINIVLHTPENVITDRLITRYSMFDKSLEMDRQFQRLVNQRFLESGAHIIYTTNKSMEQITQECITLVKKYCYNNIAHLIYEYC